MNKDLVAIFEYLEREKGIDREVIVKAIQESLEVAAQKSIKGSSNVRVSIDPKTAQIEVFCEKEIVEEVEHPTRQISLEEARELDPDCELGQFIDITIPPGDFGRIAAQKARQIISQKLRSAERDIMYEEYRHRKNELVSGTVKRFVRGSNVMVDLGKVEAIMPMREYPRTERYQLGDKVLALLQGVQDTENGGAEVVLSRNDSEFVRQLLIQEVPEISDGTIVLDKIVRSPGYRTKFTVRSTDPRVDPVGACVGVRGSRIKNVVRELNEKVDVIPFSEDRTQLLQNALDPIEIRKIHIEEDSEGNSTVSVVVDDDDYPIVIGKKGMNARLLGSLIEAHFEVTRIAEYNRQMAALRLELASSEDPTLDQPLQEIEGVSSFIMEHLITEGYDTPRKLLTTPPDELAQAVGISVEIAQEIVASVYKTRMLKH